MSTAAPRQVRGESSAHPGCFDDSVTADEQPLGSKPSTALAPRTRGLRSANRGWFAFARRRLIRFGVSLWVLVTASFFMIHLVPGDPVRAALGPTAPTDLVESRRAALGLDDSLPQQYWRYLTGLLHGDLGTSMLSNVPVSRVVSDRLMATVELAVLAFVMVMVVAIPLGVAIAALTRGGRRRVAELAFTSTSVVSAAVPEFVLATGLVYFLAVQAGWFPVAWRTDASSYVLPVLSLAVGAAAVLARIVRVEMVSVLGNDYIRTARAKRLPARQVYLRHALPNALTATLTLGGLLLTSLIAGTVLVETVFAWPGIGSIIVESILRKDYPMVQGIVLVYGVAVLLANLVVDVLLALLDPRSTILEG